MKRKQISWVFTLVILVLAMSLNPEQVAANNNTPIAVLNLSGNSTTVSPGIPITFDGTQSYDPDNTNIIAYNWWYVDGVVKSQGSTADKKIFSYNFTLPAGVNSKTFQIKLTVRDNEYITASKTITVTVSRSGRTEYYLTDHLGSIRTTIDQNGTVIGFDDYDPFGNVLPGRSYNAGTPNDLNKFTGHERDEEGGLDLDYMLARNYDSELGRFYSVDPLVSKYPTLSPYSYVANNPINAFDPTGTYIVSVHYKMTLDAMQSLGYGKGKSDLVAHYASVYADNPGVVLLGLNNQLAMSIGYPKLSYRSIINYTGTSKSQNTNSIIQSRRHSMMADYEFEEGLISEQAAMDRGLAFGWDKIFESAHSGKLSELGENSSGMKALGVGLHALQDAFAHRGTSMANHNLRNDRLGSQSEARSITKSAILVREILDGNFSNYKIGTKLDLTGMNANQKIDILNRLTNYINIK